MYKFIPLVIAVSLLSAVCSAQTNNLIPKPVSLKTGKGYFSINKQTKIITGTDADSKRIGILLSNILNKPVGYRLMIAFKKASPHGGGLERENAIHLSLNTKQNTVLGNEGYTLNAGKKGIYINANKPQGLFYGIQTLLQLLPPSVEGTQKVAAKWQVPAVTITDYPRFGWRGLMLDVSRHFFPKEVVKRYIDQMAKYKFNSFHWHLTDDNGWRIEINGLPQLTDVGAWRVMREGPGPHTDPEPGEKATYGGYYTQADIREVVQYAKDRFIDVLPEVDIPAHSLALIAAIPNISCTGLQYPVDPGTAFYAKKDNVLCVGNDSTYIVLDKIFTQVALLFPNQYIHMGGDEAYKGFWDKCPKCQKVMARENLKTTQELQSYFVKRIEKMIQSKGKKLIGWDEILEGGLAPEATVMSWRGMKGGIEAAKQGHKVIMSPFERVYLDLAQGDPFAEPSTYAQVLLSSTYNFEPVPDSVDAKLILGGQGNLWTESIANERHAQYMTWPRGLAIAEVLWSPKAKRDFPGFAKRLEANFKRFDAAKVKYATSMYDVRISVVKTSATDTTLKIKLDTEPLGLSIYYSFDTTNPDNFYPCYPGVPISIPKGARQINVITYRDDKPIGKQINVKLKELDKRL
jgi:hexosaminidase